MIWNLISEGVPGLKQDVLLCWTYPGDEVKHVRLGQLMWKPILDDIPIFMIEVDCGDSGSWFYTSKDDAPTHWSEIENLPEFPA